jgi:diacylglycerol O-acyltransferase
MPRWDDRALSTLSGLDASFFALETRTMHLHVGAVLVFEPPLDGPQAAFERLRRVLLERIHLLPFLRRRVLGVPLGLGQPVWVDDPDFDLDYHVRRASLPSPGGTEELAAFVAETMGRPLDRARPLWELYVLEGLESGHGAAVVKLHHAVADGVAGVTGLAALLDLVPDPPPVAPPAEPWRPQPLPGTAELLAHGLSAYLGRIEDAATLLRRSVEAGVRLRRFVRRVVEEEELAPPVPFRVPRAPWNGPIGPHRRFAAAELPLAELRRAATAVGVTLNDALLAVVSGALRRWAPEVATERLVALAPVSLRPRRPARARLPEERAGNRVGAMLVALPTDVEDPVERLVAAARASRVAKAEARLVPDDLVEQWAGLALPALVARGAALATGLRAFAWVPPPCNLVVSNVPGPEIPLWCAGQELVGIYPVGPVAEGVGLNVTALSYRDHLGVGILACRDRVQHLDPSALAVALGDELAVVEKAAARQLGGDEELDA